jgi:hypothetical protein
MGQCTIKDGMHVVMETGNSRHLWSLKGKSIWLRRGARSGKARVDMQGPTDQSSSFSPAWQH